MKITALLLAISAFCAFSQPAFARQCLEKLAFGLEKPSLAVKGKISGYNYCDYVFTVKKGQVLTIRNSAKRAETIIFSPENMCLTDNQPVELGQSGEYVVRVLFPRTFARRNIQESYTLHMTLK